MNPTIPIIRLEVENMRAAILTALTQQSDAVAEMVSKELDNFDIERIVTETVRAEAPKLIEGAVRQALQHGLGWDFQKTLEEITSPIVQDALSKALGGKNNGA